MDKLREDIIQALNARNDLMKWKFIAVFAIGVLGLGLGKDAKAPVPHLLSLIPFVCVYVDLICRHLKLRILVISEFMKRNDTSWNAKYEEFCTQNRSAFSLESWSLEYSTIFISLIILGFALFPVLPEIVSAALQLSIPKLQLENISIFFSSILGIILTLIIEKKEEGEKNSLMTNNKKPSKIGLKKHLKH